MKYVPQELVQVELVSFGVVVRALVSPVEMAESHGGGISMIEYRVAPQTV